MALDLWIVFTLKIFLGRYYACHTCSTFIYLLTETANVLTRENIKVVFHSCENISHISWVNFSIDFLETTSEFQMPVTFLLVDKNTKCGYSFS